ncbi:hypothetical protein Tco_1035284 [Tanacetum coccineum]
MTTPKIRDSPAYQTYLAFATGAATPKKKRIYKKPTSHMIKTTTTSPKETPSKKKSAPAKKDVSLKKPSRKQLTGVQIRDTPNVSVSKKKAPKTTDISKGIELLSDAALLKEVQLKNVLKRSKRETNIHQAGGSSERADLQLKVPDEPKGKSSNTSEGTGLKPEVLNVSKADSSEIEYESWGDSGDEENEQGDDEDVLESDDDHKHVDDEQTESDNPRTSDDEEEIQDDEYMHAPEDYGGFNVRLTNAEPDDEDKGDKEMTNADAEHENVIHESAGNQVKDDAQATQKTEVPLHIPRTSPLLTIPVSVIPEHNVINPPETVITASATTISSILTLLFPHLQQSTPILTPTKTEATTSTTAVPDSETLTALHQRIADLEKDVKELKDVILRNFADIIKEHSVPVEIVERLIHQYAPQKSIKDILEIKMGHTRKQSPKQRAIYHALMESILEDEDAMDKGVADKLKKRKPDDADKNESPSAGSDRGLKRQKTSKGT